MRLFGQQFFLRCFLLIFFALLTVPETAKADRTITSVELNGSAAGTLIVAPSATIEAEVFVTTTGNGSNSRWRSTSWTIDSVDYCYDHDPNHDTEGNYSEIFSITTPVTNGTYDIDFIAYRRNNCTQGESNTVTRQLEVTPHFHL